MAEPTIGRYGNPREEPRALAGMRGSVRGALGNQRPYRDTSGRWSRGGQRMAGSGAPAEACTRGPDSNNSRTDWRSAVPRLAHLHRLVSTVRIIIGRLAHGFRRKPSSISVEHSLGRERGVARR